MDPDNDADQQEVAGASEPVTARAGIADPEAERDKTWVKLYNFTETQLAELKEVFEMFDRTDNGKMSSGDLGNALRTMGQNPTQAEVQQLIQDAVVDDTGHMSMEDFFRSVSAHGLKTDDELEEEFDQALKVFDKEGMGLLDAKDLRAVLKEYGEPIDDDEITEMLKAAEVGGDGKIDCTDFIKKLTAK